MRILWTLAAVVLFLWCATFAWGLYVHFGHDDQHAAKWGQFGDLFGVVNSMASGAALLGLVITLLYQRKESETAREAQRVQNLLVGIAAALSCKTDLKTSTDKSLDDDKKKPRLNEEERELLSGLSIDLNCAIFELHDEVDELLEMLRQLRKPLVCQRKLTPLHTAAK